MIEAEKPTNEKARLAALHKARLLDTGREEPFDDLTRIAAQVCDTPIALVSLVDDERQWFKSCVGLTASETPRSVSFCAHAIHQPDVLFEVEDASKDERFRDNPLVTKEPYIRFYAGVPLIDFNGFALGTLCVIDTKPKKLSPEQRDSLKALARQVNSQIEWRSKLHKSDHRGVYYESIIEMAGDVIYELAPNGSFSYVNEYMVKLTGRARDQLLNRHFLELIHEEDKQRVETYYKDCIRERLVRTGIEFRIVDAAGKIIWVAQNVQLLYNADNQLERAIGVVRDISADKAVQRELQLTQFSVDASPVGIAWISQDARMVSFNDLYCELTGFSAETLQTKRVYDFDPNFDSDSWSVHWQEMKEKGSMRIETQFHGGNDQQRDIELRLKYLDFEGTPYIHAVCLDISERNKIQRDLVHYKDLLERSNRAASIGTWEVDLIRNRVVWSQVTREIHEVDDDFEPDVETGINFYKGSSKQRVEQAFSHSVQHGTNYDLELMITTAKGNDRWVRAIGVTEWENGRCQRIYGLFQDIHETKVNSLRLRQSEEQFRNTFEYASIGMALVDLKGRWIKVNGRVCEIVGYQEQELLERTFQDITHPDDIDTDLELLTELTKGERETYQMEKRYIKKNGDLVWVLLAVSMVRTASGRPLHYVSQIADISEQKQAQAAVEQRSRQLELAHDEMERFAYIVTHDLKLPLSNIRGHAGIIKLEAQDDQHMIHQSTKWIEDSLDQAENKITGLLEVARQESESRVEKELAQITLRPIVQKALDGLQAKIEDSQASIRLDIPESLTIKSNATILESAFENLLGNALKYSKPDVPPQIKVDATISSGEAVIRFSDNGLGMDLASNAGKLFTMFGRFHEHKEGTGIGLYLTKKSIEAVGGKLSVESTADVGSVFSIHLPN